MIHTCTVTRIRKVAFRRDGMKGVKALRIAFEDDVTGKEYVEYYEIGHIPPMSIGRKFYIL